MSPIFRKKQLSLEDLKDLSQKTKKETCLKTLALGILAHLCVYLSAEGLV